MLVISRGADDATDLLFALQADGGAACPSVTSLSLPAKYIDIYTDSVTVLSDILAFFPRLSALDMTIDCGCPEFHVDGIEAKPRIWTKRLHSMEATRGEVGCYRQRDWIGGRGLGTALQLAMPRLKHISSLYSFYITMILFHERNFFRNIDHKTIPGSVFFLAIKWA
ncbi:hypothetical protein B0H13DRAFT_1865798 [Mycena leptocephala]|nr:hypothetical protein B0H13DRAFT_1865798 [Mycena leptocephala]